MLPLLWKRLHNYSNWRCSSVRCCAVLDCNCMLSEPRVTRRHDTLPSHREEEQLLFLMCFISVLFEMLIETLMST